MPSLSLAQDGNLCFKQQAASRRAAELKEIFDEVGVSYKGLSKDALKAKAYKEGVMRK